MAKDMYVVKLGIDEYAKFARWITEDDGTGTGTRRYERPPGLLSSEIETQLKSYPAKVHEYCDQKEPTRDFGKDDDGKAWNCDIVETHRDCIVTQQDPSCANNWHTCMAIPDRICLDAKGDIDLSYLKGYVADLCNETEDNAAWSLLGMYFLSRCR